MLTPADAERLIEENLSCLPIESLPLWQCAGAILRENIYGERQIHGSVQSTADLIRCVLLLISSKSKLWQRS